LLFILIVSNLNIAGSEAQLSELTDYICAAQMVKDFDAQLRESPDEEDSTSVMTSYSYTMVCYLILLNQL